MRPTFREDLDKILSSIEENKQGLPDQTYIDAIEALGRVRMYGLPRPCPAAQPGTCPSHSPHHFGLPFVLKRFEIYISQKRGDPDLFQTVLEFLAAQAEANVIYAASSQLTTLNNSESLPGSDRPS